MVIKVPQSSYRVAKEKGCVKDYLFYLSLKTVNIQGTIPLDYKTTLKQKFNYSPSKAYTRIKSLLTLGWITRNEKNYSLVSYDRVWQDLGFILKKNGKGLLQTKIFKISLPHHSSLQNLIYYTEIDHNLALQRKQVRHHHSVGRSRELTDTDKIARKLQKKYHSTFSESLRELLWSFQQNLIRGNQSNHYKGVNYDITLSCEGTAKLFGYQTPAQGHIIQRKLQSDGLLSITPRKMYIGKVGTRSSFEQGQYFISASGKMIRQLPNLLVTL